MASYQCVPAVALLLRFLFVSTRAATAVPRTSPYASTPPFAISSMSALGGWWRSYECKIHCDRLLQELCAVRALDGGIRFVESRVFDEDVTLSE